ncbi:MAG: GHKL domain-containing protein [Bacillota bacterium]|nr:GHKL domain-containing protein [Bacillota bacterium]
MDPIHKYIMLLILVLLVGGISFISLFLSSRKLRSESRLLMARWNAQNSYIDNMSTFHRDAGVLTEEIKKLSELLAGTPEEVRQSQDVEKECLSNCDELLSKIHSGNTVVDALLYSKQRQCERLGIEFRMDLRQIPESGGSHKEITDMEIITLLGNLLDNGIEAASAAKAAAVTKQDGIILSDEMFVSITGTMSRGVWLVKVVNSKDPAFTPLDNHMKTTKVDSENHGLGVRIIKQIAKSHDGVVKMNDHKYTFETTVYLPIH